MTTNAEKYSKNSMQDKNLQNQSNSTNIENSNYNSTQNKAQQTQSNAKISKKPLAISIFFAILFGIIIANVAGGYIANLFKGLLSTFVTFGSALAIIFLLKHLMSFIENRLLGKVLIGNQYEHTIKRLISIIVAFLTLILIIFLIMNLIIPRVIEIVNELVNNRDTYIYQIKSQLTDFVTSIIGAKADDTVNSIMNGISAYLEDTFNNFLPQVLAFSTSTITTIGHICMGGFLAFLYLFNRESINKFFANIFKSKCKPETVKKTYNIMTHSDKVLVDYIIAKIIEAIIITVVIGIGLSIINVNYAFELALIIGILNVIPYIGFIIALVPLTFITIIYGSIETAIQALIVTTIIYVILTTFVTPVIVGKKIKCNILLMFSAMIVGGGMFGIIGMAIAPPVACIGAEIFKQKMCENRGNNTSENNSNCSKPQKEQEENNTANNGKMSQPDDYKNKGLNNNETKQNNLKPKSNKKTKAPAKNQQKADKLD